MRLTQLVFKLNDTLRDHARTHWRDRLSPTQAHKLQHLELLPTYHDLHRIDLWETAFPPSAPGDDPHLDQLIEAIFLLGCHNLYTQYNPKTTLSEYRELQNLFAADNIPTP